jgi:WXXGXW repeat (2 copies)
MTKLSELRMVAALVAYTVLGGCVTHHVYPASVVYVRTEPPVTRVETVPVSPGRNYVWVTGYWRYSGDQYLWVPGSYVVPASGYTVWVPGRWDHDGHGYFWRAGYWR